MKKYKVILTARQSTDYIFEVEADDSEDAGDAAADNFLSNKIPYSDFKITEIEEIKGAKS